MAHFSCSLHSWLCYKFSVSALLPRLRFYSYSWKFYCFYRFLIASATYAQLLICIGLLLFDVFNCRFSCNYLTTHLIGYPDLCAYIRWRSNTVQPLVRTSMVIMVIRALMAQVFVYWKVINQHTYVLVSMENKKMKRSSRHTTTYWVENWSGRGIIFPMIFLNLFDYEIQGKHFTRE